MSESYAPLDYRPLIQKENWLIVKAPKGIMVRTEYTDTLGLFKFQHPALIHLEIYRKHTDPNVRYQHLKKAHDYFWPDTVWHYWTEVRFRAHCMNYNYISLAAGASASKSYDIAKLAILFWYANPQGRNVTIASVTLASLMTRVWGYLTKHIKTMNIPLPYKYYRSTPPRVLLEEPTIGKNKIEEDTLHGIFSVTAKIGDDNSAIATWIGKHPDEKILIILDEATDMPLSILDSLPNLNSHPEKFQLIAIGNSASTMDLHGVLSTPKNGWDSVSIDLAEWETTQPNGICLYFNPYESPAVLEEEPERRKTLSRFLANKDGIDNKEKELGKDSENFYRWVLGFWKSRGTENTPVSEKFLQNFNPRNKAEWSGFYPITRVGGLDPAFSTGGDNAILRIANVGHSLDKRIKMDFLQGMLMFKIPMIAMHKDSIELQLVHEVVRLCVEYGVTLDNLGIDITGQGRGIGELIKQINEKRGYPMGYGTPLKIYSMGQHNVSKKKNLPDVDTISTLEIYNTLRMYIQYGQICGLDDKTINQITNRLIVKRPGSPDKLEPKSDYKRRMAAIGQGHSPDEADASALCALVMQRRLGISYGMTWEIPTVDQRERFNEKLYAHNMQLQAQGERTIGKLPDADFSGGLETYITYQKPF